MGEEFIYFDDSTEGIVLEDHIKVIKDDDTSDACIVSNSQRITSHIYAPEINFYARNTEDSILEKAKNISALYEARAIGFDMANYFDYFQEVGNNILLVSEDDKHKDTLKSKGFNVIQIQAEDIEWIEGHLGALNVGFHQNEEEYEIETHQIIWFDAPEFALEQSGVFNANDENIDEIIENALSKVGDYKYKNFISYDTNICQYHERNRKETCGKCAEVCPTVAIVKDDPKKHLVFSHIDCLGCGGCISVCPSGALDYTQMTRDSFFEISKLYRNKIPLIIPRKMDIENLNVTLKSNVLPFAIEGEKYLHEEHFLTLLQESGSNLIFYTDFLSKGTREAISLVNDVYQAKYNKPAIYVCMNEEELKEALPKVGFVDGSHFTIYQDGMRKREIFSARLALLVQNDDLGYASSGEWVRYGVVDVNQDACTLCLSCVGACNVGALIADEKDYTLKFNASICTACGYCEPSCPEKDCLTLTRGKLYLKPETFTPIVKAQDELFECVECHKPFATRKSVEKIANMMKDHFKNDPAKLKTLYCCADCKAKVMILANIQARREEFLSE